MKITKGTIVRTILLSIALINMILRYMGKSPIYVLESDVLSFVDCAISVSIIVIGFWKNNSYTKNAMKADELLRQLNAIGKEE